MTRILKTLAATTAIGAVFFLGGCTPFILSSKPRTVPATAETDPMIGKGDKADDPALWVHPSDPGLSLILGTNKKEGLFVYDLTGRQRQHIAFGRVNNVDVRGDLAVASNYQARGLSWVRVSATEEDSIVDFVGNNALSHGVPYGVCLGVVNDHMIAGVTYRDGTLELWKAIDFKDRIEIELVRTEKFATTLEGCVFDDPERRLFVGEELHGVWSIDLADSASKPIEVDTIEAGNGLVKDVEGVSLYAMDDGSGYLVVSAQGADRFVVYERQPPHAVVGMIRITSSRDGKVDRVTHTDGIEVSSASLPQYPRGLLIVQDDANPIIERDQNFKLVDWRDVEAGLSLQPR